MLGLGRVIEKGDIPCLLNIGILGMRAVVAARQKDLIGILSDDAEPSLVMYFWM